MKKIAYVISLALISTVTATNFPLPGGLGSINRGIGFLLITLWLLSVTLSWRLPRLKTFHLTSLAYLSWNALSLLWSYDVTFTLIRLQALIQAIILTVVLKDLWSSRPALHAAMQAYILGGYVSVASTAWDYVQDVRIGDGWEVRYAAGGFNANDLGSILALGIPIAWWLASEGRRGSRTLALLNLIYPFAAIFGIVLSASRGPLLVSVPGILLIVSSFRRVGTKQRLFLCVIAAIGLAGASRLDLEGQLNRLSTIQKSITDDGMNERRGLWLAALDVFMDHPFRGIGFGAFPAVAGAYGFKLDEMFTPVVHNTFLSILSEAGLVGLALLLTILVLVARDIAGHPSPRYLAPGVLLLSWAIASSSLTLEYRPLTWIIFSLITVSYDTLGQTRAAPPVAGFETSARHPRARWPARTFGGPSR